MQAWVGIVEGDRVLVCPFHDDYWGTVVRVDRTRGAPYQVKLDDTPHAAPRWFTDRDVIAVESYIDRRRA